MWKPEKILFDESDDEGLSYVYFDLGDFRYFTLTFNPDEDDEIDLLRKYPEDLQFPNEIRKPNPKKQQGIQNGRETEKIISIRTGMGAQHDMRLAKRHLAELYPYKIVIADKGYQGLAKTGLQTPKKKSKHHPLNKQDKEANRRLGRLRTVIGHINRKLKIFKILSLPYRNRRKRFGLRANLIAGLVNAMG